MSFLNGSFRTNHQLPAKLYIVTQTSKFDFISLEVLTHVKNFRPLSTSRPQLTNTLFKNHVFQLQFSLQNLMRFPNLALELKSVNSVQGYLNHFRRNSAKITIFEENLKYQNKKKFVKKCINFNSSRNQKNQRLD